MTGLYEWNPMPHFVDVKCPDCSSVAHFEFAEMVKIKRKEDIEYFLSSNAFEYAKFQDSCGDYWHAAIYYSGLSGNPLLVLADLPEGYEPSNWRHSRYLYRNQNLDIGSIVCEKCNYRKKHLLNWPSEANFSVVYKGHLLWAYNRDSATELFDYINSKNRDLSKYRWRNYLLHVPTIFKEPLNKTRNIASPV